MDAAPNLPWARTRRLALAEFQANDVDALVAMHRDPRVRAQLMDDYPLDDPAVVRTFIERMGPFYRRNEGLGIWRATVLEPTPTFAGWFNLMPIAHLPGEVELGSRLLPAVWGTGIAQEGGALVLDHAFDRMGLARVWGICHPGNRSALGALAALGFESVGLAAYDGVESAHYQIKVNAWREIRDLSPTSRIRRALRGRRASQEIAACAPNSTLTLTPANA
jgi:RimJ/RimL family protein N-acetyltransferase